MGVKRVTKKFLRYLIPILLISLVIPVTETGKMAYHAVSNPYEGTRLRCAISLGDFDQLSKGYLTGYNYEMLHLFADSLANGAEVFLSEPRGRYLDSLMLDSLDILVIPAPEIPAMKGFAALYPVDSQTVWLIKSDYLKQRKIGGWLTSYGATEAFADVKARFFGGYNPYRKGNRNKDGIISPYDDLIKAGAEKIGWDWRMFAALIWSESKFRIQALSPRGAFGLMQMMPVTASRYEVEDILSPRENIDAGAEYLVRLQNMFRNYAADEEELVKYTLAAYNAGEGRVLDMIAVARASGMDTTRWDTMTGVLPSMDQDSIVLNENVRHGRFNGGETRAYVRAVLNQFDIFCGISPRYAPDPADSLSFSADSLAVPVPDSLSAPLLRPDSLGRIDVGDEEAGDKQQEHNDQIGSGVGQDDPRKIQVNRNEGHEIVLGIQFQDVCPFLDGA